MTVWKETWLCWYWRELEKLSIISCHFVMIYLIHFDNWDRINFSLGSKYLHIFLFITFQFWSWWQDPPPPSSLLLPNISSSTTGDGRHTSVQNINRIWIKTNDVQSWENGRYLQIQGILFLLLDCYDSSSANMPKQLIFGLVAAHNSF